MVALAGVGQPTGLLPAAQQPKKAVPEWLRAEMLSRGISLNAAGGAQVLYPLLRYQLEDHRLHARHMYAAFT